ncbi:MAG: TetR/AcrR family transcriptional regulator [Parvibaculum sp.]
MQTTRTRLSRDERRQQMLGTATRIVAEEGTDNLTLAVLAERAGVSKPVAYDHFETRTGLLLALLSESDSHYENVARENLATAPQTLEQYSNIVANAYVACAIEAGPAAAALAAAVEASGEGHEAWRASRDRHVAQFEEAFRPVLKVDPSPIENKATRLVFVALVAAANALCNELTSGHISRADAETTLSHLFTSSLGRFRRQSIQSIPATPSI